MDEKDCTHQIEIDEQTTLTVRIPYKITSIKLQELLNKITRINRITEQSTQDFAGLFPTKTPKLESEHFTCRQCGHSWRRATDQIPKKCPDCSSRAWNREKQRIVGPRTQYNPQEWWLTQLPLIKKMRESGSTVTEIAQTIGTSKNSAGHWIRKYTKQGKIKAQENFL